MAHLFRFKHVWHIDAPVADVHSALERADDYPMWWPEVKETTRTGPTTGTARIRSKLPYTLELQMTADVVDALKGILRTTIEGDLRGFAEFTCRPAPGGEGTIADYRQEVTVQDPWIKPFARIAEPILRANHTAMMHSGERGLRRYLAG